MAPDMPLYPTFTDNRRHPPSWMGSQANQNGEPAALDMLGKPAKITLIREVKSVSLVVVAVTPISHAVVPSWSVHVHYHQATSALSFPCQMLPPNKHLLTIGW